MAAHFVVPVSVAGWTPRPTPFNVHKCGRTVRFSEEASVAERVDAMHGCNAVVYTARPLVVGHVWSVTVQNTTRRWRGGLVSVWVYCASCNAIGLYYT